MQNVRKNEQAVSPVIGVILMVVITVIIAAILAVFAFGIGAPSKAPEVNLKFTAVGGSSGYLKVSHEGGEPLILKDEKITVTDSATGTTIDSITSLSMWASSGGFQLTDATLSPGKSISHIWSAGGAPSATQNILTVQIVDIPTGQLIANAKVVVQ